MIVLLRNLLFDSYNPDSLAWRLRYKRFAYFKSWLAQFPRPLKILDVGGTIAYWKTMGFDQLQDIEIVLLNLEAVPVDSPHFTSIAGDATDMSQFRNKEFDIVFSNSVIEHVGDDVQQAQMAREIMRVGKAYFVQTPSLYFPIESHSCMPFYQFMPTFIRTLLLYYFDITGGGIGRTLEAWKARFTFRRFERMPHESWERCHERVKALRLLSGRKFRRFFPNGKLYKEKCFGLTKSYILHTSPESV